MGPRAALDDVEKRKFSNSDPSVVQRVASCHTRLPGVTKGKGLAYKSLPLSKCQTVSCNKMAVLTNCHPLMHCYRNAAPGVSLYF
jgi:hypothetical protein